MAGAGSRRHRVRLENLTVTADLDGGFTETWTALTPAVVNVAILPATAGSLERFAANTVASTASHIVEMPYHSGVTTKTRVRFKGRTLTVVGVQNPEERKIDLVLACVETVA